MSTAELRRPAPAAHGAGPGVAGHTLRLDPARPLHLARPVGQLTLAAVSIAWLRDRGEEGRAALEDRHLTAREAAHAATLRLPRRRREWLAGRLAVKHAVLAHRRGQGPGRTRAPLSTRDVRVDALAHGLRAGKPFVELPGPPVEIGLTHSADFAVAVCGPRPVGVDLEHARIVPPHLRALLEEDADPAARDPDRRRLTAMPLPLRWACKEAVLKYFGFGLRVDPRDVALRAWYADHAFAWRPGPELLRHAPAAAGTRPHGWAAPLDGYFLALVWT
ncbi:4'-phosphopantetheinyl transferase family protein [Streptomyces gamaensis]|uniref:4'-phosphopantetheinyl transferase family protein n=1 Tax=Streptomyces gamaensis TaxID=1763542 RepID=A0ABW0YQ25_9ACTN